MILTVQQLVDKLIEEGLATHDSIIGCTSEEVEQLEKKYQGGLPQSFKEFLSLMGRRRGRFFAECDFAYPFESGREVAQHLFNESGKELTDSVMIFLERYGCAVVFFDTKDGIDPPVYVLQEGRELKFARPTFLDWLNLAVEDAVRDYKELLEADRLVESEKSSRAGSVQDV